MPQGTKPALIKRRKRGWFPRILFYGIAAALLAGALGYFFKDNIAAKIPALDPPLTTWKQNVDSVVSKVVPANPTLSIENVKYDIEDSGGEKALLVTAEVIIEGSALKLAPNLVMTIFGENNTILNEVSLPPRNATSEIPAGDRESYFLQVPNPPENLERVEVDFAK